MSDSASDIDIFKKFVARVVYSRNKPPPEPLARQSLNDVLNRGLSFANSSSEDFKSLSSAQQASSGSIPGANGGELFRSCFNASPGAEKMGPRGHINAVVKCESEPVLLEDVERSKRKLPGRETVHSMSGISPPKRLIAKAPPSSPHLPTPSSPASAVLRTRRMPRSSVSNMPECDLGRISASAELNLSIREDSNPSRDRARPADPAGEWRRDGQSDTYKKKSKHCHLCIRTAKAGLPHVACSRPTCRKAVCMRCFSSVLWDRKSKVIQGFECPHCTGACSSITELNPQCRHYKKAGQRRKQRILKKRTAGTKTAPSPAVRAPPGADLAAGARSITAVPTAVQTTIALPQLTVGQPAIGQSSVLHNPVTQPRVAYNPHILQAYAQPAPYLASSAAVPQVGPMDKPLADGSADVAVHMSGIDEALESALPDDIVTDDDPKWALPDKVFFEFVMSAEPTMVTDVMDTALVIDAIADPFSYGEDPTPVDLSVVMNHL